MSDASPPPRYDPTWTPPRVNLRNHHHRRHNSTGSHHRHSSHHHHGTTTSASGGSSSRNNSTSSHNHHRVPLLSTTDDDEELLSAGSGAEDGHSSHSSLPPILSPTTCRDSSGLSAGESESALLDASASTHGLLSYSPSSLIQGSVDPPPPTPPSPVPLILLPNGHQHFRCSLDDQDDQPEVVTTQTNENNAAPSSSRYGNDHKVTARLKQKQTAGNRRRHQQNSGDFTPSPLRAVGGTTAGTTTSPSRASLSESESSSAPRSTSDSEADREEEDDEESQIGSALSSPPSYPDSPPSYPDSPPSYPHSPPEYPVATGASGTVLVPGYHSDVAGQYIHCILPPREVPCLIMASPIPPSSSNYDSITVEPATGSHSSLSGPLGSGNSLSQHATNNNNGTGNSAANNNGGGGGGEGSRSSLNHPVVVRTGSRNSLTHERLGSKHSLSQPGISRKSMTRHSFHHPPQGPKASQLMRTASTHAPRTSPLHRDRNSNRSKGSNRSNSNRSLSPSIPFYPHNLPGTRSASWNDLDPTSATSADSNQVTLILQDINPDSTAIYLTHVNHPATCQLIDPTDLQQILLAEGQRDIDQFEDEHNPKKRRVKLRNVCLVFWSLACHLGFFICIGLLAWQVTLKRQSEVQYEVWANHPYPDKRGQEPAPLHSDTLLIVASVLLVVCYVFSWIESCVSDTHRYIDHKMELTKCRMYVRRMRVTVPKLRWSIDCYHWSSEDPAIRNSGEKPQHEKIITHTEVEEFPFSVCKDASGDLGTFKKSAINRFEFEKTFGFIDQATADVYEQRKQAFMQRNMYMDKHYTFKEIFELDGMESHMTVYVERGHLTKLMSFQLYSCLACCLLTWPYRILFRCFTKKRKFTFVKLLGL